MDCFVILSLFVIILKLGHAYQPYELGGSSRCSTREHGQEKLHIHLIAHSHDDVGWLKTVDQYFYGTANYIQNACVKCILDSVLSSMWNHPKRKFIYSEIAFFWRWWKQLDVKKKEMVRILVKEERLQFVNGGWVMNDEAAAHYTSIIDQYSLGLRFIAKTFGKKARPRAAWEIDPFGHSSEQSSLLAQMGFDGVVFARINIEDKIMRKLQKTLEMVWQGDNTLRRKSRIFTSVLFNHYTAPDGFNFESYATPDLMGRGFWLRTVDYRISEFIEHACDQAESFKTRHLMVPMGTDFAYSDAERWFSNMDVLIKKTEKEKNVKILYSTPWEYIQAVNQYNVTWPLKTGDFFPYADNPGTFWSGYFSSRPTFKRYVRYSENLLQACKQVEALYHVKKSLEFSSWSLQDAVGIAQHHDAVSGTCQSHVIKDYKRRLTKGNRECLSLLNSVVNNGATQLFCSHFDQSQYNCKPKSNCKNRLELVIYNPMSRSVKRNIIFPLVGSNYIVKDSYGNRVQQQQTTSIATVVGSTRYRQKISTRAKHFLHFKADLPPVGYRRYSISIEGDNQSQEKLARKTKSKAVWDKETFGTAIIDNGDVQLVFSKSTGGLMQYKHYTSGKTIELTQDYLGYPDGGGAYLFEPRSKAKSVNRKGRINLELLTNGPYVKEVRQIFCPWVSQIVRLYAKSDIVEIDYVVGPLPNGISLVTHFKTNLISSGIFFTDANGRHMIKRKRNFYPTIKFSNNDIAGNYYPLTTSMFIQDKQTDTRLTVYTDRSLGGTSLTDGAIELMLHRRLEEDDGKGLGESLNERDKNGHGVMSRGKIRLHLSDILAATKRNRILAEHIFKDPILLLGNKDKLKKMDNEKLSAQFTTLPINIQLLTAERINRDKILVRLQHLGHQLSKPISVNIASLFRHLTLLSVTEMGLGGNVNVRDIHPLKWKTNDNTGDCLKGQEPRRSGVLNSKGFMTTLKPAEIRTFIIAHKQIVHRSNLMQYLTKNIILKFLKIT